MINQELVGKWSTPVLNTVEKEAVRKFAEAIGDLNPLYIDEEYAASTRLQRLIAPPTFSRTFDYGSIEGLDIPVDGLIHGEQTFHFERPIYVGEQLLCSFRIADTYTRKGSLGKMTFLIYEQQGLDSVGDMVFTSKSTVVITEKGDE